MAEKRHPSQLAAEVGLSVWVFSQAVRTDRRTYPGSAVVLIGKEAIDRLKDAKFHSQFGHTRAEVSGFGQAVLHMPDNPSLTGDTRPASVVLVAGAEEYPTLFEPLEALGDLCPFDYAQERVGSLISVRAALRDSFNGGVPVLSAISQREPLIAGVIAEQMGLHVRNAGLSRREFQARFGEVTNGLNEVFRGAGYSTGSTPRIKVGRMSA